MIECVMKQITLAGYVAFLPPGGAVGEAVKSELARCAKKNNGYVFVSLRRPAKPRTTGRFSQNNHIWGHAAQIANYTGNDIDDVVDCVKRRAMKRGYPYRVNPFTGLTVPYGIEDTNTEQAAMLIEELHVLGAELDMVLKEQ